MSAENVQRRFHHVAVNVKHYIIAFGGTWYRGEGLSMHEIWMYNTLTKHWRCHMIPHTETAPPPTYGACAAAIGTDIYMFGGNELGRRKQSNALWKLTNKTNRLRWSRIEAESKARSPSPRLEHTGWAYDDKMWVFGGYGKCPDGYLLDHGEFNDQDHENNQLLCFDPNTEQWTNPELQGEFPDPRSGHASTIIAHTVWLYGGFCSRFIDYFDDLFSLDMNTLVWTEYQPPGLRPSERQLSTLAPITDTQLLLHGSFMAKNNDIWILNTTTMRWSQYNEPVEETIPRWTATCNTTTNGGIIIVGGEYYDDDTENSGHIHNDICIQLVVKSLQQLAMQTIHDNRKVVPWQMLPNKLVSLMSFGGSADDDNEISVQKQENFHSMQDW